MLLLHKGFIRAPSVAQASFGQVVTAAARIDLYPNTGDGFVSCVFDIDRIGVEVAVKASGSGLWDDTTLATLCLQTFYKF